MCSSDLILARREGYWPSSAVRRLARHHYGTVVGILARTDADPRHRDHLSSRVYAGKRADSREFVEPVSGFEPLTVRLQGGCSAKLSYTGRLIRVASDAEPLPGYRFDRVSANRLQPPWRRA